MRIVSLDPGATETLRALGLDDELVGVTHRCEDPATTGGPEILTRPGSRGGDALDAAALVESDPDLVVVGDGTDGAVGRRLVEAAFADDESPPSILVVAPASVEGILNSIVALGAMTEAEDQALAVVEDLRERLKGLETIVLGRRDGGFAPPRVAILDGFDPPHTVGRWIPDQVRLAGGWELLGQAGGPGAPTGWDAVADIDPEVIVLLHGGLPLPEAVLARDTGPRPAAWAGLRAVQAGRAFVVDGRPFVLAGPRVVDGIEILAELLDPVAFDGMSPPSSWLPAG